MRPKRWWDSAQGRARIDRNCAACESHPDGGPWAVCPCHGRRVLFSSWAGLTKRVAR